METKKFEIGDRVVYSDNKFKIRKGIIKSFEMWENPHTNLRTTKLAIINKEAVFIKHIIRRVIKSCSEMRGEKQNGN